MPKYRKKNGNHGGRRRGAGRPKSTDLTIQDLPESGQAQRKSPRRDLNEVFAVIQASKAEVAQRRAQHVRPFQLPAFPPAATPPESLRMAMDDNANWANGLSTLDAGTIYNNYSAEGLLFPGYTYLSELAQRPEYRILAETIPDDATRKWIKFEIAGTDDEVLDRKVEDAEDPKNADARREERVEEAGLSEKVKKIEEYLEMLHARERMYDLMVGDNLFGRMHLHFNFAKDGGLEPANVLKTSIGDGYDRVSRARVSPRTPLQNLKVIEPVWTYPMGYNAQNPLLEDFYNPQYWYVLGQELHTSRLMPFITRPVPDILKSSYAFGGLSMTQLAEPYVNIWLRTRQSVADLIHSFSVMILQTDMSTLMQPGGAADLLARMAMFNALRDNQGSFVVNKNTEDVKNVAAPISGLDHLQAQAQEHMASVGRLPLVKLTGISPSGLNASSEGEIRIYYDTVNSVQERKERPVINRIINFAQLSLWGEIDKRLTYIFEPLQEMSEKEKADLQKAKAERDQIYVSGGAVSAEEWRRAIINDPALPYADLNPEEVPEPPENTEGLGGEEDDNDAGSAKRKPPTKEGGQANDEDPFGFDVEWKESDHPRAPDGKFGSGGGATKKALSPKNLTKIGEKMGSNDGGTFKDSDSGKTFYIKKPASAAHVTNELLGAKLYQMAGGHTLDYHPVEGGKHVATELAKLDVNNVNKFTPAEKKKAQKDFAVQAWIGNWDAAGTGGDNKGILNGKPTALDFGGALEYRAQGEPKGAAFGNEVQELLTMLDSAKSPDNAKLYGSMTHQDQVDSATQVTDLTNDDIITQVKEAGGTATLAQKLIERKNFIAEVYGLPTDTSEWDDGKHPRNPDGTFAKGAEKPEPAKPAAASPEDDGDVKPGAYGGLWKASAEGTPAADYEHNVEHYMKAKSQIGIHYRRMMTKILKDADKYGLDDERKDEIKEKLIESLEATHENLLKKAVNTSDAHAANKLEDEAKKVKATIDKLAGGASAPKAAPKKKELDLSDLEEPGVNKENSEFAKKLIKQAENKEVDPAAESEEAIEKAMEDFLQSMETLNSAAGVSMPQMALGALNLAVHHDVPLEIAMEHMPKAQKAYINAQYGSAQNAIESENQKKENAKPKAEKDAAAKKIAFAEKFVENMASKDASYKTPLNLAKQKVKAAAQVGMSAADVMDHLTKEEGAALTGQYGSITEAYKKSAQYVTAEQQQVTQAAQAQTQAATIAKTKAPKTDAQKAAAIAAKEDIAAKVAKGNGHEIMKDVVGLNAANVYKQNASEKIASAGYSKYITADDAVPILAYTASYYQDLNAQIRQGVMQKDQYLFMKSLNKSLSMLPPYTEKTYRKASLTKAQFDAYQAGNIIEERSFTSTAKTTGVWSGNYHYEIIGKSGRDISKLSVQGTSEQEVLFPAGSRFIVERVEGNKIVMHEVD